MILLIAILVIIWFFLWDLKIEFQKKENSFFDVWNMLNKIENITWKLYYSPGNSWDTFYNDLSSTQEKLMIQTYEFTKKEIKSKIKDLLNKWVDVKLIMEDRKYQQFQNTWKQVEEYFSGYENFEIKSDEQMWTEYVHSKINLVDSWFWIQTANLTHSSFYQNREHFFYSNNIDVWNSLNKIFQKDWNWENIKHDDIHPNLLVCNINCRDVIEYFLENAENSILIQTQYIVDDSILGILKSKFDFNKSSVTSWQLIYKGVRESLDIRFVVSNTESNDDLLDYFWPAVARKFNEYYNHTKMILIDDKYLILWSMNLSDNSLDKNREIWIILVDQDIVDKYKKLFENDWRKSKY